MLVSKVVIYDYACQLAAYCMVREPEYWKKTRCAPSFKENDFWLELASTDLSAATVFLLTSFTLVGTVTAHQPLFWRRQWPKIQFCVK